MKRFKDNHHSNWEDTRKIGRLKYSFTHGIAFGVIVFITNLAIMFFLDSFKAKINFTDSVTFLLISITMGVFGYYSLMWWIMEKLYQKKEKDSF